MMRANAFIEHRVTVQQQVMSCQGSRYILPRIKNKLYTLEVRGLVRRALITLDERELHIIRNRFGLLGGHELTLEEIGKSLNLSRERVRQLEREAKAKLRASLSRFQPQLRYSLV